jgi:hypothetical protein
MTALKHEAIQLVKQMPEEQMPYIIQYIRRLNSGRVHTTVTPKMEAFLELENMLVPMDQELDYDKELAEARDEKYDYFG